MQSKSNKNQTQKNHIHKVKRLAFNTGNKIYFCVLDDCNYKVKVQLFLGKKTICWRCGEAFNMNEYSIRLAKPHCENCHQSKDRDNFILPVNQMDTSEPAITGMGTLVDLPTSSLSERLNKIRQTPINHVKHEDEEEL